MFRRKKYLVDVCINYYFQEEYKELKIVITTLDAKGITLQMLVDFYSYFILHYREVIVSNVI